MNMNKGELYEFFHSDGCEDYRIKDMGTLESTGVADEETFDYRCIFDNNHTIMLLIDPKTGEIRDANPAACKYYGYSRKEMLKLKINDLNMLTDSQMDERITKLKIENIRYFKFKHKLSNGEIRDVEVYSGPVKIGNRELIFSIIHDVQVKAELIKMLSLQKTYFTELFEKSPEAIAFIDNDFKIININKSFENIFLYDAREVLGKNITQLICEKEFYSESLYFMDSIKNGEFIRTETVRKRKDGKLIDVSFLGYPIISDEVQKGIFCIYADITRAKEDEKYKKLYSEVFKNSPVGVAITTVEGKIQWVNDSFTRITGYGIEEVKDKKANILKSGVHNVTYYRNMWDSMLNVGQWKGEIYNKRKNGEIYLEWLTIIATKDYEGNITHFIGMFSDITNEKNKDMEINRLTYKDSLTQLYNRHFFKNKLDDEIQRITANSSDEKLGILFIDLNDFKDINDTMGHLAGDKVLQEFSVRILECIRENDIVARFGGDEFIILLQNIKNYENALEIGDRILDLLKCPIKVEEVNLNITASIGVTMYPDDGSDYTALVRNADIAMYKAKESGGNKITLFDASLNKKVQEVFWIRNYLRYAIERGEMFLNYQPIFDTNTGEILGTEALLRWKVNKYKIIEPTKFIPIAERSGMMHSIGEWVMLEACRQNKSWQTSGYKPIFVSVNVSVVQLEEENFFNKVERILRDIGLDPRFLQIEITETILGIHHDSVVSSIDKLSGLGIKISIDDFGTGYSSLGQLNSLNISELKIDKSFISEVNKNEGGAKIVKAIIAMSKNLKLQLIAEGVETPGELEFLKRFKCDMVQGYLFSKPVDPKSIEKFLK